jgi:KaiC/GvpD/RAD55 family RecA-like ATPase
MELYEQIINKFKEDGKQVDEYEEYAITQCPSPAYHKHGDKNPSFMITKKGRYKCLVSGCELSSGGTLEDLAEKIGLQRPQKPQKAHITSRIDNYIKKRLKVHTQAEYNELKHIFSFTPTRIGNKEAVEIDLNNGTKKKRVIEEKEYRQVGKMTRPPFVDLLEKNNNFKAVFITEGTFDALTFWRNKLPAISTEGGQYTKWEDISESLRSNGIFSVILAFDNDETGKAYTKDAAEFFLQDNFQVFVFPIPEDFKDVNEFYINVSEDEFKKAIDGAKENNFFRWFMKKHEYMLGTPFERNALMGRIVYYYGLSSRQKANYEYIEELLDEYNIDTGTWLNELSKVAIIKAQEEKKKTLLNKLHSIEEKIENKPLENIATELQKTINGMHTIHGRTLREKEADLLEEFEREKKNKTYISFLGSVFFLPSDVVLLTAPTKTGKTTFALNMAYDLIKQSKSVLYITYEMGETQILKWFTGIAKGQNINNISTEDMREIIERYGHEDGLFLETGLDTNEIAGTVKYYKPDVFIVDYDQLVPAPGRFETEERRVSYIVESIKSIATQNNNICILLSQINNEGRARYSQAKEHTASIHIHLERSEAGKSLLSCNIKLNRHGPIPAERTIEVDWPSRKITSIDDLR